MRASWIRSGASATGLGILVTVTAMADTTGVAVTDTNPETRTLVILGASYAQGWGAPALPGFQHVINRGVGGDETGGMLRRFPADVVATKPDAVLIWGHVNDISRAKADQKEAAKTAARRHFDQMLRQARAAGIEVILATEIPWAEERGLFNDIYGWVARLLGKSSYAERTTGHVEDLNDYLRALAAREQLRLLDFARTFANQHGTRKPEYAAADGSHISTAGYRVLTNYAQRELAKPD